MKSLQDTGELIQSLKTDLDALNNVAAPLRLSPTHQTEWYQLITQKLLPQLTDSSYLVIAVVGGTNIGKSVIFNHLCGVKASATSPLASGTKHPTCLVPSRFASLENLQPIFSEFVLEESDNADDALRYQEEDVLFWRELEAGPDNLLLLDTPDIDSDAEVNWARADKVRRAADVLIAVLTQQKYNDAAVKKFFRTAAEEEKTILIVFNQCLLPDDEEYWPIWIKTFCEETGVDPESLYLAPHDRPAAESNKLPFYVRPWPADAKPKWDPDQQRNLMQDLSDLRFDEIKLKSLSGAIGALADEEMGIPTFLEEIRRRAGVHGDAYQRLTERLQEITVTWPVVPNKIVIQELRNWWREQRTGWQASVHGFYDTVGKGLMYPIRMLQQKDAETPEEWIENYRRQEWRTIQEQLFAIYDRLESLAEHGHPVLAPRLNEMMSGNSREETLAKLRAAHQECDYEKEIEALVYQQMKSFREDQSEMYTMMKRLDSAAAMARPAVTVALFATGFGPVGQAMMPVMTDSALQVAMHVAGDVTAGTITAAVGETAISKGASTGMGFVETWFHNFHQSFVNVRQIWLLALLQQHLWGTLLDELHVASAIPHSDEFKAVQQDLRDLKLKLLTEE